MAAARDIDTLLKNWDFQPGEVNARLLKARNGREVLQMRVDMGLLQMETDLRPDGLRPHGAETYYDYLVSEVIREGGSFRLSKEQCGEADRGVRAVLPPPALLAFATGIPPGRQGCRSQPGVHGFRAGTLPRRRVDDLA